MRSLYIARLPGPRFEEARFPFGLVATRRMYSSGRLDDLQNELQRVAYRIYGLDEGDLLWKDAGR